jgi:hypothetical protein
MRQYKGPEKSLAPWRIQPSLYQAQDQTLNKLYLQSRNTFPSSLPSFMAPL